MGIGKVSGWTAWVAGSAALAARHSLGVPMAGGSAGKSAHEDDRGAMMASFFSDVWEGDAALPQPSLSIPRRNHGHGSRQLTEALSERVADTRPETLSGLPATLAICQADPSGRTPLPSRETFARAAMELLEVAVQPDGDAAVAAQLARTQVRPLAAALGAFVAQNQASDAASLVGPDGDYTGAYLARAASAYPFGGPADLQTKLAGVAAAGEGLAATVSSAPAPQQPGAGVCQAVGDSLSTWPGTGVEAPPLQPVPRNQQAPSSAPQGLEAPGLLPAGGADLAGGMQTQGAGGRQGVPATAGSSQSGPPAGTGSGAGGGAGVGAGAGMGAGSRASAPLNAGSGTGANRQPDAPLTSQTSPGPRR